MPHRRHAVYWLPPPGPLAARLADWLGWDPVAGEARPPPALPGLPRPAAEITERPRRYGPHATLRPPMRLVPGQEEALRDAVAGLAAGLPPARAEGLAIEAMGPFLALCAEGGALSELAAAVIRATEPFRAEPTPEELARRRAAGLTARQDAMLLRWGYPYVMEEFRFHLTLTGPLDPAEAGAVRDVLAPWLEPLLPRPFELRQIALLGEGEDGFLREIERFELRG